MLNHFVSEFIICDHTALCFTCHLHYFLKFFYWSTISIQYSDSQFKDYTPFIHTIKYWLYSLCCTVCLCGLFYTCVCSVVSDSVIPWIVARQIPLSMEFSRQKYWSGLPFPPPGDPTQGSVKPTSLGSAALAGRIFTTVPPGKPRFIRSCL